MKTPINLLILFVAGLNAMFAAAHSNDSHEYEPKAGMSAQGTFHMDSRGFKALPKSDKDFQNNPDNFQFAIISDRTGGHRTPVFRQALEKINLLQPEFVVSVGDMIEGYTEDKVELKKQWTEIDGMIDTLDSPYFYTPGNHDYTNNVMANIWKKRYGADYYHMVYKDVLFLVLNTEAALKGLKHPQLDDAQYAYAQKVLSENQDVRWTMVFLHQPLWKFHDTKNWDKLKDTLAKRQYTAFAGHMHSYDYAKAKTGQELLTLGSTGGISLLRGTTYGEFDHVTWITMNDKGPVIANLKLDGILDKHITDPKFDDTFDHNEVFKGGTWFRTEDMLAKGKKHFYEVNVNNPFEKPLNYKIDFKANSHILLKKTELGGVLEAGKSITHKLEMELIGVKDLNEIKPLNINGHASYDINPLKKAEWDQTIRITPVPRHTVKQAPKKVNFDGKLDDWEKLPHEFGPTQGQDGAAKFDVRFDDEYLYVALTVQDDDVTDSKPLGFDGSADVVYFKIDSRPSEFSSKQLGSTKGLKKGHWIFAGVSPGGENGNIIYKDLMPKGFISKAKLTKNGFTAELRMPISHLNKVYGSDWKDFRINVGYLDTDPKDKSVNNYYWQLDWDEGVLGTGLFFKE